MDELIVFLLFGWMEMLVSPGKNTGGFIITWIIVAIIGVIIYVAVVSNDVEEEPAPVTVEQQYSPTEQSFIDLCKSRDGTVSRDLDNPDKLICI